MVSWQLGWLDNPNARSKSGAVHRGPRRSVVHVSDRSRTAINACVRGGLLHKTLPGCTRNPSRRMVPTDRWDVASAKSKTLKSTHCSPSIWRMRSTSPRVIGMALPVTGRRIRESRGRADEAGGVMGCVVLQEETLSLPRSRLCQRPSAPRWQPSAVGAVDIETDQEPRRRRATHRPGAHVLARPRDESLSCVRKGTAGSLGRPGGSVRSRDDNAIAWAREVRDITVEHGLPLRLYGER